MPLSPVHISTLLVIRPVPFLFCLDQYSARPFFFRERMFYTVIACYVASFLNTYSCSSAHCSSCSTIWEGPTVVSWERDRVTFYGLVSILSVFSVSLVTLLPQG